MTTVSMLGDTLDIFPTVTADGRVILHVEVTRLDWTTSTMSVDFGKILPDDMAHIAARLRNGAGEVIRLARRMDDGK